MVLWASAFVVIRALSAAVDPGPLALGRLLVGSLVLTAIAPLDPVAPVSVRVAGRWP